MPISKEDAQWYGLPENTNYFIASKNGGLASNLKQAPDGTIFQFSDTKGLEGFSGFFKKQGNAMVPISQQEAQGVKVEKVNAPASSVNSIGMGITPLGGAVLTPQEVAQGFTSTGQNPVAQAINERPYLAPYRERIIQEIQAGADPKRVIELFSTSAPKTEEQQRAFVNQSDEVSRKIREMGFNPSTIQDQFSTLSPSQQAAARNLRPDLFGAQQTTGSSGQAFNTGNARTDNLQSALDVIKNSGLPDDVKLLFNEIVRGWDPSKEVNIDNVINEFNRVKTTTIDPYFQEMSRIAVDEITRAKSQQEQSRALELEAEGVNARNAVDTAHSNLEARGMTFTGEARKQLGGLSAYGAGGEQGNQIQQVSFGSVPIEGTVNTGNRLMSSSSSLRYRQQKEALARNAEKLFGSSGSTGMFEDVTQLGGVTGTMPVEKNTAYANAIIGAGQKEGQNSAYKNPILYNFDA